MGQGNTNNMYSEMKSNTLIWGNKLFKPKKPLSENKFERIYDSSKIEKVHIDTMMDVKQRDKKLDEEYMQENDIEYSVLIDKIDKNSFTYFEE